MLSKVRLLPLIAISNAEPLKLTPLPMVSTGAVPLAVGVNIRLAALPEVMVPPVMVLFAVMLRMPPLSVNFVRVREPPASSTVPLAATWPCPVHLAPLPRLMVWLLM